MFTQMSLADNPICLCIYFSLSVHFSSRTSLFYSQDKWAYHAWFVPLFVLSFTLCAAHHCIHPRKGKKRFTFKMSLSCNLYDGKVTQGQIAVIPFTLWKLTHGFFQSTYALFHFSYRSQQHDQWTQKNKLASNYTFPISQSTVDAPEKYKDSFW